MHWFLADLHYKGQSGVGTIAISWLENGHGHDNDDDDDNDNIDLIDGEDDEDSCVFWKLG